MAESKRETNPGDWLDSWLLYGFIAAVLFGVSAIAMKLAIAKEHFNLDSSLVILCMLVGIAIVFAGFYAMDSSRVIPSGVSTGLMVALLSGALWAMGSIILVLALKNGADLSKLAPIYNTNTLIAVVIAIFLLNELPDKSEVPRVLAGAILIVVGSALVGK